MSIQRWGLSRKWVGQLRWVKSKTGEWCKYYAGVEELETKCIHQAQLLKAQANEEDKVLLRERIAELEGQLDRSEANTKEALGYIAHNHQMKDFCAWVDKLLAQPPEGIDNTQTTD